MPLSFSDDEVLSQHWTECGMVTQELFDGTIAYQGPRYFRCTKCHRLVTRRDMQLGGCVCGNNRAREPLRLTALEKAGLKIGYYRLLESEKKEIRPHFLWLGWLLRLCYVWVFVRAPR